MTVLTEKPLVALRPETMPLFGHATAAVLDKVMARWAYARLKRDLGCAHIVRCASLAMACEQREMAVRNTVAALDHPEESPAWRVYMEAADEALATARLASLVVDRAEKDPHFTLTATL